MSNGGRSNEQAMTNRVRGYGDIVECCRCQKPFKRMSIGNHRCPKCSKEVADLFVKSTISTAGLSPAVLGDVL